MITLSINLSYLCNFNCDFCYLTPSQLHDSTKLPLERLDQILRDITAHTTIGHVDMYGGEVSILPEAYYREAIAVIRRYHTGTINVVTNFLRPSHHLWEDPNTTVSVSYDFECRERHTIVRNNMVNSPIDLHVLTLATPCVMAGNVDDMIDQLNAIPAVKSVELKPYSTNQANQHSCTHADFEQFVRRWITSPITKRFTLTNEQQLRAVFYGQRNSFSNDHLYITPQGTLAVLEFDLNDNEFFKPLTSYEQYVDWTLLERNRVFSNQYCSKCPYLGRCLTEHLRDVKNMDHSCNGYYQLIEWYSRERMEG